MMRAVFSRAAAPARPLLLLPRPCLRLHPRPLRFSTGASPVGTESLSQRLKRLLRENGKVALIVYFALSAIDLGLTFFAVYSFGAEHVRDAEDWVLARMNWKRREEPAPTDSALVKVKDRVGAWAEKKQLEHERAKLEAQHQSKKDAMWTSLLLAYTIHKTALLPVRIGLTAAITPRTVRFVASLIRSSSLIGGRQIPSSTA
jgi:hypothetical protein